MSVIDDSTHVVVANITVAPFGATPLGVACDPGQGEIFVTIWGGLSTTDDVAVVNDSTNRLVTNITVGGSPEGVTYAEGLGEVLVANFVSGTLSVIDDATNGVVATLFVSASPAAVAYDPGRGELFVAEDQASEVVVVNATTDQVVTGIPVGHGPSGLVYDPHTAGSSWRTPARGA